jgi:hypothetical protein
MNNKSSFLFLTKFSNNSRIEQKTRSLNKSSPISDKSNRI